MIAYHLAGISAQAADRHDLMAGRLRAAGPWEYRMCAAGGTMAAWPGATVYGTPRAIAEGVTYHPPAVLPTPDDLARQARAHDELVAVEVDDCGTVVHIVPALMTPRAVLCDGKSAGAFATAYGREAHAAFLRIAGGEKETLPILAAVCRRALAYSYRLTDELLDDLGWLNESSVVAIWEAVTQPPKAGAGSV